MDYGFKLVAVACNCFAQLIIFCAVHQMSRLYDQILYTVINSTLQCLIHIIDFFTIPCLHMVDDDLRSKCTSYGPVGICFLQCFSMPPISSVRLSLKEVPKLTTSSSFSPISSAFKGSSLEASPVSLPK